MSTSPSTTTPRPSNDEAAARAAVDEAADEMIARWQRGERPLTEEYLDRFPVLRRHPEAALELLAEELALRDEYGEPAPPAELADRFPLWQAQVRALVQCHRVLGPQAAPRFPAIGDLLGEFQLVSELGRGAHARVYLATQPSLGGRPVALKLGPTGGHEHLSLARLQHTSIVPLYSAHDFPEHGLRGLCLPYFGGATLADVLVGLPPAPTAPVTGADILSALRQTDPAGAAPAPLRSLAWDALGRATYSDAVCWIGSCLADALQYAHDRGLLHLDVKPSNVLIAADGVPMLLDFHLARPPLSAGDPAPPWLGGTPGYMAPEQLAAVAAVRAGTAVPAALDPRTDVYALGVVLVESLQAPGRGRAGRVPPGLAAVLARCMSADPAARYPTAAAVATDLRRHLADQPLKGVANRSLAERWAKWRRRRPLGLPLVLALAAVFAAAAGFWARSDRQADRAAAAFQEGETHLQHGRYAEAVQAFRGGETLLDGVPFRTVLRAGLRDARRAAERGQAADELDGLCEEVRPLYAADVLTPDQVRAVGGRCRELWARRDHLALLLAGQPNPELEVRWRTDLLDLGVLTARFGVPAAGDRGPAVHRQALATLAEAEAIFGPSCVLQLERDRHLRALRAAGAGGELPPETTALPPRTAWEHLAVGRVALGAGDLPRAAAEMDRALQLDPGSYWANYYKGTCRLRTGDPVDALAAFSVCVSLAPRSAWCFHNRGLAYAEMGRLDDALADLDRALALDPGLGAAWPARAAVHQRAGRFRDALADLRQAAGCGVPVAVVEYQTAVVHVAMNDRAAAVACLRTCLAADPDHRPARDLLGKLTTSP